MEDLKKLIAPCLSMAEFVPHNMKLFNLLRIKKIGIEKWREESKTIVKMYIKGEFVPGTGPVVK